MQTYKLGLLSFLIVLAVTASVLAALQLQKQSDTPEEPTPVRQEVKTEKELEHSRIYKKEYEWRGGKKLSNLRGKDEIKVILAPPSVPGDPSLPPPTANEFLRKRTCAADAVVLGIVKDKSSLLTEDETFTFTQYNLAVEEVLKNNAAAAIQPNSIIDVTRPGGAIHLNGRVIRAVDLSFPPLKLSGRYLLFLKFIRSTGAYKAFGRTGDFELENGRYTPLTKESLPSEFQSGGDAATLLAAVRAAAPGDCK
jgi:hypothetical protein